MKTSIRNHWLKRPVPPPYRLPLLVLGFMALAVGVLAGLRRLGFDAPLPSPGLIALHGPLMVSGFFGTLISLERAVALGARWTYGAPAFAALGALALVGGAPVWTGALLLSLGSAFLVAGTFAVFLRQRAVFTSTLLAGAVSWLIGNLAWLAGLPFSAVVPWWAGFLVLTIAGERLELSRFLAPPAAAQRVFIGIVAVLLAGFTLLAAGIDARGLMAAGGLLALTLWLVRYDIARRTVHTPGLTRFIAVALLSGYVWLGAAAVIALAGGGLFVAPAYDATLHAVFLGFVFSMVFGHAPIILPAVTHFAVRFHQAFYVHLALLHLSLLVRLGADLAGTPGWRSLGGLLNAMALLVFIVNTASGIWRGRRNAPASTPQGARIQVPMRHSLAPRAKEET